MVPDEEPEVEADNATPEDMVNDEETSKDDVDEEEAVVEDVTEEAEEQAPKEPKMKPVTVEEWIHMNSQPPIWMR